jgi:hypothetical protein
LARQSSSQASHFQYDQRPAHFCDRQTATESQQIETLRLEGELRVHRSLEAVADHGGSTARKGAQGQTELVEDIFDPRDQLGALLQQPVRHPAGLIEDAAWDGEHLLPLLEGGVDRQ